MTYATFENLEVGDRIAKTKYPRKNWWIVIKKDGLPNPLIRVKHSRGYSFKDVKILYPVHFRIYRWYKVFPRNLAPRADVSKGES